MLLEPRGLGARLALRRGAGGAAGGHARPHRRRDARLGARARHPAARRHRASATAELSELRSGLAEVLEPLGLRARRGGHAPVHAVGGHRGLPRRALPVPLLLDARARPPRADLRPARARRRAEPRAGGARLQPHARAPADAARAVGQLAVLAGPRHRAGLDAHAAVPGLPARRDPAHVPLLRRLRREHRHAAALRRLPRADVPVVGRAAAAALRHARGAGDGRADARRRHRRADRARAVPRAPRGARGAREPHARRRGPRCSRRTASSPRATGWRRASSTRRPSAGGPRASGSASCSTSARRTPPSSAARPSSRPCGRSRAATGAARQRSRAGRGSAPQLGRVMHALHSDFTSARSEPAVLAV